jgi:asparagine synthetase B (glutamine-hydrolysing)
MYGIASLLNLSQQPGPDVSRRPAAMNELQRHPGPDGGGHAGTSLRHVRLAHRRLSIFLLRCKYTIVVEARATVLARRKRVVR